MRDLKICEMNIFHYPEICSWDRYRKIVCKYEGRNYFENDFYPAEGHLNHLLSFKKVKTSKIIGKGINEKKSYVLKNEKGKIVAFTILHIRHGKNPSLYIAHIEAHPLHQGQNYGTYLLETILTNPQNFMSVNPETVVAIIDEENKKSMHLFESLATLKKRKIGMGFVEVSFDTKNFQKRKETKEFLI